MRQARRRRGAQRGYTYLALMILISIIGITAAASAELGAIYQRRMAEKELLKVGETFQRALQSYASATPLGQPTQPRTLDELLRDPRYPNVVRHLRRIYDDPMTGKADWVLVKAPDGQTIVGIHSASQGRPIQIKQFPPAFQGFDNRKSYTDWVFIARYPALTQGQRPGDNTLNNGDSAGNTSGSNLPSNGPQPSGSPSGSPFGSSPGSPSGSQPGSPFGTSFGSPFGSSFGGNSPGGSAPNGSLFNSSPSNGSSPGNGPSNSSPSGQFP
ncbi:type II secretion system protein [Paraburkholderia humisilvae]|uniref:Type II secretion system protein G n=1 Tax=Paraburkholderia humisilvae TaxID=627669 RepID=A0A6J5EXB6_9BURK|nr:type II secretion system protein [Paraburkholderia humisilvae]CAB3769695.1 hypothetical protein LMG29542_06183 [Paraburkholderia humisilvae]